MECKHRKEISRRDFLKTMGVAGAASAGLAACSNNDNTTAAALEIPKDQMTYRTNPKNGDKVSLLGFGMMRLLGACYGHRPQPPSTRIVLCGDQTLQFRPIDLEPRGLHGHVREVAEGIAGRLHRLYAPA